MEVSSFNLGVPGCSSSAMMPSLMGMTSPSDDAVVRGRLAESRVRFNCLDPGLALAGRWVREACAASLSLRAKSSSNCFHNASRSGSAGVVLADLVVEVFVVFFLLSVLPAGRLGRD